jgi:hypothetical protein
VRALVATFAFSVAVMGATQAGAQGPSVGDRVGARVQRVKTALLSWKLAGKEKRALARIEKERSALKDMGIHAAVPVGVTARKAKLEILQGLAKEAALLRGASPGSGPGQRRAELMRKIATLQQEIAEEASLIPKGSVGVSTPYGVLLDLEHTKGEALTQNLAHELTHARELDEQHRLMREMDRIRAKARPSRRDQARLRRYEQRIAAIEERIGSARGDDEVRADYNAAFALGKRGKPIGTRHMWGLASADPGRYPPERMAQANIDGFLAGVADRLTGGSRALSTQEQAYLDGYRAFLVEGARRSFTAGASAPQPQSKLDRVRNRLGQSVRMTASAKGAYGAGHADAMKDLPPNP